jgi:acyl-CoA synthetase (AMP-forming)/AMP-acid ligase II
MDSQQQGGPPLEGQFGTVDEAMEAAADQFADDEAYVEGARRLTFGEWIRAADALAGSLAARGVAAGDVVALMLPPSIDYAICYAAAARLGAVATGLNTRLGPREVDAVLQQAAPAIVVRDETLGLPPVPPGTLILARDELPDACAGPGLGGDRAPRRPDDPVTIIWTSGTTGVPKGAWFDHVGLQAAVEASGVMAAPFDRRLVPTPFAHAGYMAKLWEQLAWGMTLVLTPPAWRAEAMLRLLVDERITVGGGVPTQWAKLLELPALDGADLSRLRLCVIATAPASPELVTALTERLGCPVVVRYAMTESPTITGTAPGDDADVLCRTVGRPQAGVAVAITDASGRPVPAGEVGHVRVRSRCTMRGYWGAPELTAEVLGPDGWLRTGDLGRLDEAGNLVLVGRARDMYIRGGYNVYPLEVEHVLAEHPGVGRAAVLGMPAPVIGEVGVAVVVPAEATRPPSLDDLRAWCRARLADYNAPDRLVLADELPLTPMLKVDKAALRATVLDAAVPGS